MPATTIPETVEQGYWVKVKNEEVLEVWNTQPNQDELDSGLWREAVEVFPEYTPGREELSGHTIDISTTPVQIRYQKIDVDLLSRIDAKKYYTQEAYRKVFLEESEKPIAEIPSEPDLTRVENAKVRKNEIYSGLDAVTTHDELDDFDLTFSV